MRQDSAPDPDFERRGIMNLHGLSQLPPSAERGWPERVKIRPVPMWLSSLGRPIPNRFAGATIAIVGVGLSCGILYHGILALCRTREDVVAGGIVQTVIGVGLVAWAFRWLLALA
jgi:hypothetical protein